MMLLLKLQMLFVTLMAVYKVSTATASWFLVPVEHELNLQRCSPRGTYNIKQSGPQSSYPCDSAYDNPAHLHWTQTGGRLLGYLVVVMQWGEEPKRVKAQIWMCGADALPDSEAAVLKAGTFPWPKTFRELRKTLWIPPWTGKAGSSGLAALTFLSEQVWVMRLVTLSFLALSDSWDLLAQYAYLFYWTCLIFCSDLTPSLPNFLFLSFPQSKGLACTLSWDMSCREN